MKKTILTLLALGATSAPGYGQANLTNQATEAAKLTVAKDFKVELLYSVPKAQQDSWVTMTHRRQGAHHRVGPIRCVVPHQGSCPWRKG